jgi:hypothetical protein
MQNVRFCIVRRHWFSFCVAVFLSKYAIDRLVRLDPMTRFGVCSVCALLFAQVFSILPTDAYGDPELGQAISKFVCLTRYTCRAFEHDVNPLRASATFCSRF